ncbi:MAG: hypothetical protein R3E01_12395 [Pirellulaceae bacterium]|nr:hypothetical protein [Planctomycetales bacterium]
MSRAIRMNDRDRFGLGMGRDRDPRQSRWLATLRRLAVLLPVAIHIWGCGFHADEPSDWTRNTDTMPVISRLSGERVALNTKDLESKRGWVCIFIAPDCPISNRYVPEYHRLAELCRENGLRLLLVYPSNFTDTERLAEHCSTFELIDEVYWDEMGTLVSFSGASITPQAVVIVREPQPRVVYRGRIDNWYEDFGKYRPAATEHDVRQVITAIGAGAAVEFRETAAVGCPIPLPHPVR